jgi:imidazolonepropionase-like amidohydrolase
VITDLSRPLVSGLALGLALLVPQTPQPAAPAGAPDFTIYFLGHAIGAETDTVTAVTDGHRLDAAFQFVDRGTTVTLSATLDSGADGAPRHLVVKGRNYRLFSSDSDVTVSQGRAHVRDHATERDVAFNAQPFFPIDNYGPIGIQQALLDYWRTHGSPSTILGAPSGPIHIVRRGDVTDRVPGRNDAPLRWSRVSIDGPVWGRETAWIAPSGRLDALTTWAGALPMQAVRPDLGWRLDKFMAEAVTDRIDDLEAVTKAHPPVRAGAFALVGATVIDGSGAAPIADATVLVRNNRIAAVGPRASTPVPAGVPSVDARGRFVIPGLWDSHAHASQTDWAPVYLASGVTTIRDMGGEEGFLIAMRDAVDARRALGPRYVLAGLVDGPGPHAFGAVTAGTPEEGAAVTRRYHGEGFVQMKIYSDVNADVVRAITAEAHKLGMTVTGHVPTDIGSAQAAVDAGFDGIAHMQLRGVSGSDASKAQIAFFKAHGTVMDPTESWNELSGRPAATPLESILPGVSRLPMPLARMFASMSAGNGDSAAAHQRIVESVKLLKDAVDGGLLVLAGTDKGVPGFSLQREIELYVEGGMTPLEAIQTATIMPARSLKMDADVGTIAVGKRADFVVLAGDPIADIHNIRKAVQVAANGSLYDCNTLWAIAGYGVPAPQTTGGPDSRLGRNLR